MKQHMLNDVFIVYELFHAQSLKHCVLSALVKDNVKATNLHHHPEQRHQKQ